MQRLLAPAAALFAWALPGAALKLHGAQQNHTLGAHLKNLAGESFEVNQPGEHVLLRAPPESTKNPVLRVSGHFSLAEQAPCPAYADAVMLKGDWLGKQTLRVSFLNGSLHIKVSSSSPPFSGPWRKIHNYTAAKHGHEAIPDTLKIMKTPDNTGFTFYAGTAKLTERPIIKVKRGFGEGLDVALANLKGFKVPKVAGLLGSYKHSKTVETRATTCAADAQKMRKSISTNADADQAAAASSAEASTAVQSVHFRNLVHEKFMVRKPGKFVLLRVPTSNNLPALIEVRGNFVVKGAPCVVVLDGVTLTGTWFGNKTVDLVDKTFGIKVSTAERVGPIRSIEHFVEASTGPEALPSTVKILKEGRSFRFQVGMGKPSERANINVTQTANGGLDVVPSHMERTQVKEIGGLLGMEKHDTSLDTAPENCRFKASSAASSTDSTAVQSVQSVQFQNLVHEKFTVRKPGKFVLLRVPTSNQLPALMEAKGYFVEMKGAPCVVLLDTVSFRGRWFGNKTVYLSSKDKMFGIKVSSPGADGTIRSIEKFVEASKGPEALPSSVKITTEGRSFTFQVGPGKPSDRASVLVTQTVHGGLDVVPKHMENTQVKEIGGLLGMEKHDKSLDTPPEKCAGKAKATASHGVVPHAHVHEQLAAVGSLLTASWNA